MRSHLTHFAKGAPQVGGGERNPTSRKKREHMGHAAMNTVGRRSRPHPAVLRLIERVFGRGDWI
jgi:hypothetical protein